MMVDGYYHKQDLQTVQTREIVSMLYNVNRVKGPPKTGKDFMPTFDEDSQSKEKSSEIPDAEQIEKIKEKYGGSKGSI